MNVAEFGLPRVRSPLQIYVGQIQIADNVAARNLMSTSTLISRPPVRARPLRRVQNLIVLHPECLFIQKWLFIAEVPGSLGFTEATSISGDFAGVCATNSPPATADRIRIMLIPLINASSRK